MSKPTKDKRSLAQRVEDLERIVSDLSLRLLITARTFNDDVRVRVLGQREVRGNDGVLLSTRRDKR